MFAAGLMLLIAGIWLAVSPFVLGYEDDESAANAIACGAVVSFLALLRIGGIRGWGVAGAAMLVGLWLFGASFWLADSGVARWNDRSLGAIVFFLGFLQLARSSPDPEAEQATSDLR